MPTRGITVRCSPEIVLQVKFPTSNYWRDGLFNTILNSSHALVNQPNAGPFFTTVTRNININVFTSVLVSKITNNCSYYNGEVGV